MADLQEKYNRFESTIKETLEEVGSRRTQSTTDDKLSCKIKDLIAKRNFLKNKNMYKKLSG